ncbi:hypothetical protein ACHQM5_014326 [Ranunculus cassubicifolius]
MMRKDRPSSKKAPSVAPEFDYPSSFKDINNLMSSFNGEKFPDAASEKDQGNEYFKQKKFNEAIDCYSRSIALSPTAVAYANRAMAYLKIKRFEEAENDCTEALSLDDRYIKAYSRRATARKELGKLKASVEDCEFSLRLEPQNQELKKQHAEVKAMYGKEILGRVSEDMKNSTQEEQRVRVNKNSIKEVEGSGSRSCKKVETNESQKITKLSLGAVDPKVVHGVNQTSQRMPVQELATRAAALALAEAEKNITPPKSAYQFEISWKKLSGDRALQARMLKTIPPSSLPQLFKSLLSPSLLMDIVKCICTFFEEEIELGVNFLENLTKVSRFDMIILCLSAADKLDVKKMWEDVILSSAVPVEYVENLSNLRSKYCL